MFLIKILFLVLLLFSAPAESNPLHPSQAEFPKVVQIQRGPPISLGPTFIKSTNYGIQASQIFLNYSHCNECSKGSPLGTNPRPENNWKEGLQQAQDLIGPFQEGGKSIREVLNLNGLQSLPGNADRLGFSSKDVFEAQAMDIALAKAKEKGGRLIFLTNIKENEERGKHTGAVKGPEAVSYVISKPSETPESSTAVPQQQTATTQNRTEGDVDRARTTIRDARPPTSEEGRKPVTSASVKKLEAQVSGHIPERKNI